MWEITFREDYRRRGYDLEDHNKTEVDKEEYKELKDMYSILN